MLVRKWKCEIGNRSKSKQKAKLQVNDLLFLVLLFLQIFANIRCLILKFYIQTVFIYTVSRVREYAMRRNRAETRDPKQAKTDYERASRNANGRVFIQSAKPKAKPVLLNVRNTKLVEAVRETDRYTYI